MEQILKSGKLGSQPGIKLIRNPFRNPSKMPRLRDACAEPLRDLFLRSCFNRVRVSTQAQKKTSSTF